MDQLVRALAFDDTVRVVAAVTTDTVQTAMRTHETAPTASAAIGRLLTAAALLGAGNKGNERLTLQLQGDGPFGMVLARTVEPGKVYGTIRNPGFPVPPRTDGKLDVGAGVGTQGTLMVVRDLGMREPYVGTTPIVTGEIGDEIAHYLAVSEQVQSAVGVGVLVSPDAACLGAGGFLVQILGDVSDEKLEEVETRLAGIRELSRDIEGGLDARALIDRLTGGDHRVLDVRDMAYECPLDRDYYRDRLVGLGAAALADAFGDDPELQVVCEMARVTYTYERAELLGEE